MSGNVALQADVGSLGLSGLGAFTTLLSAASTDNVQPMAMILLENLGSLFHVNGPHASRVPEVMTRVVSHPVGRLSLAIGWRRGDAISVFAETAGGQAITLLATGLVNIYESRHYGLLLSQLCTSLLPKSLPRSSPTQLADVAKLIAAKAAKLSFGNILARQTHRVLSVYDELGMKSPAHLLEKPSVESLVQLFESLTHLNTENHIIRISGSVGLLYIATIVLFMFPGSTMLTVESVVIHNNENSHIIIEICEASTQVQVETKLGQHRTLIASPIERLDNVVHWQSPLRASLQWDGWLVEALRLHLAEIGVSLTSELKRIFCEFMVQIAPHLKLCDFENTRARTTKKLTDLVGPHYQYRIASNCRKICHYDPSPEKQDPVELWIQLAEILERDSAFTECSCPSDLQERCVFPASGWNYDPSYCPRVRISRVISLALSSGILCCLVEPQGSVTVSTGFGQALLSKATIMNVLRTFGLESTVSTTLYTSTPFSLIYYETLNILRDTSTQHYTMLGKSFRGCSIYPTVLHSFETEISGMFIFSICDGMFIHDDRYYDTLNGEEERLREQPKRIPDGELSPLRVSQLREHISVAAHIREGFGEVLLGLKVQASGLYFGVNVKDAVIGLMYLDFTPDCQHSIDDVLHEEYEAQVSVGSVGTAPSPQSKVNILMTRGNQQAQFVACGATPVHHGDKSLLLKCCLNCGVRQALEGGYKVLIVA
ncbi:hypothetical protein BJ166DRAFT_198523 [Pestalotiopsis sp. NC0098]|nr:hypothetical protein BJ166DRAFT_198523 [Pestalotiopsis sp. NC0098]